MRFWELLLVNDTFSKEVASFPFFLSIANIIKARTNILRKGGGLGQRARLKKSF
jgi:hypothetical protein